MRPKKRRPAEVSDTQAGAEVHAELKGVVIRVLRTIPAVAARILSLSTHIRAVVRNNSVTRRHAPANIRDAVHLGLVRLELHTILRDDVGLANRGSVPVFAGYGSILAFPGNYWLATRRCGNRARFNSLRKADHSVLIFIPKLHTRTPEAGQERQPRRPPQQRTGLKCGPQVIVRDARRQVMNVVIADIAGKPMHHSWQIVVGTSGDRGSM
jgi:hypothetical protein